jgi:hypothetical protein
MAKAKTAVREYSEAEIAAIVAAKIAERDKAAKAARDAAKDAASRPGLHSIPTTDKDRENNVLARCLHVGQGVKIHGTAVMVRHGETLKVRYGLSVNPIFGIPGDTDTDAEALVSAMAEKAKQAPAMLAMLAKAYAAAAKSHTFNVRERKGK